MPIWLLGALTLTGTLGIHIFVPATAAAAADLHSGAAAIQLGTSVYILGLALGQLAYGPLSDHFGRRKALFGGLVVYTLAGIAACLASDATMFVAARFVQALGGCSGMVIARAIVRDTSEERDANRGLATMNLVMTAGPGVAPLLGGFLAHGLGWRAIFGALIAIGAVNLFCVWRWLGETRAPSAASNARATLERYGRLLLSPVFLGYALGGGCATTAWYAFVGAAPAIYAGQSARVTGVHLGLVVAGVWIGSVVGWRSAGRIAVDRLLLRGTWLSLAAALLLLAALAAGARWAPLLTVLMFAFNVGVGVAGPAALTRAMGANGAAIGSASGLYGFTQMVVGAACAAAANIGPDPALAAGTILVLCCLGAQTMFWMGRRAHRRAEALVGV